jgi:hypothetical protein
MKILIVDYQSRRYPFLAIGAPNLRKRLAGSGQTQDEAVIEVERSIGNIIASRLRHG